jgi:hypothetical protein
LEYVQLILPLAPECGRGQGVAQGFRLACQPPAQRLSNAVDSAPCKGGGVSKFAGKQYLHPPPLTPTLWPQATPSRKRGEGEHRVSITTY